MILPSPRAAHCAVRRTGEERSFGADDGWASLDAGDGDTTGLSRMAERLRSEATGFLAGMRR